MNPYLSDKAFISSPYFTLIGLAVLGSDSFTFKTLKTSLYYLLASSFAVIQARKKVIQTREETIEVIVFSILFEVGAKETRQWAARERSKT